MGLTLAAILISGCTREANEDQIRAALQLCHVEEHARVLPGTSAGASTIVIDFALEGRAFREKAACVQQEIERLGLQPVTMFGGPGRYVPSSEPKNPPQVSPEALNALVR